MRRRPEDNKNSGSSCANGRPKITVAIIEVQRNHSRIVQLDEVSNDIDTKICRRLEWFWMELINQESILFRKLPTSTGSGIERHHGNSAPTPNTVYAFHLASILLANARNPRRNGFCVRRSTSVFCWATVKFLHRSLIMYMRRIDVGCRVCQAFCIEINLRSFFMPNQIKEPKCISHIRCRAFDDA